MNKLSALLSAMIRFRWILLISLPAILLLLFLLNLSFSVTGAKYAEDILITVKSQSGLESTKTRLSAIRVFRLSLNDNDVAVEKQSSGWKIHQSYAKRIRLDIPKELLVSDLLITLKIGSKTFNLTGEEIQHTWTKVHSIRFNTELYESDSSMFYATSRFPKLSTSINWPSDAVVLKKAIFNTLLLVVVIPIGLVLLYFLLTLFDRALSRLTINIKLDSVLFLLIVAVTMVFIPMTGIHDIKNSWFENWWYPNFEQHGFIKGYQATGDNYPPLGYLFIGTIGTLAKFTGVHYHLIYKASLLLFLIVTALALYFFTKNLRFTSLTYLFLSVYTLAHGYFDIVFAPFLIVSLYFLRRDNWVWFTIFLSLTVLIKYQPVILIPFLAVYILTKHKVSSFSSSRSKRIALQIIVPSFLFFLSFLFVFGPFFVLSFFKGMQHSALSANALNVSWIITWLLHLFAPDQFGAVINGRIEIIDPENGLVTLFPKVAFVVLYVYSVYRFFRDEEKTFEDLIKYMILGYLTYFMWNTGVHQNHLFIGSLLYGLLVCFDKGYLGEYLFWEIYAVVNLVLFYGLDGASNFQVIYGINITPIVALLGMSGFVITYYETVKLKPINEINAALRYSRPLL